MQQRELAKQLQQTKSVDVGTDGTGAPLRIHRFTPVQLGRSGQYGVINRVTEEFVAEGLDSLHAADRAITILMRDISPTQASPGMSF